MRAKDKQPKGSATKTATKTATKEAGYRSTIDRSELSLPSVRMAFNNWRTDNLSELAVYRNLHSRVYSPFALFSSPTHPASQQSFPPVPLSLLFKLAFEGRS